MQLFQGFQIGALCIVAQTVVQQVIHHQTDGVDRALGHGGMAALAPAPDTHPIAFRLQRNVGGIFQLGDVSLHQCTGAVGDCIVGNAALELLDLAVADRADQLCTEMALLAVAHRELRIRSEAEHRGRVVLEVVFHIVHVGLFVVANHCADGIPQGNALLLEELQGVQGSHHGALVIGHTTADHPAVPDLHLEGVLAPAVAHGHHIHMADGCQILLGVCTGQLGIADVVLAVAGRQTHACSQLQRLVQRRAGALTKGSFLGRGALHTVDGHQRRDVLQNLLLVRRNKGVDLLIQCLIHDCFVLSLS